jgi:cellulose synthase/poly-beta-1,6-N-acetylglucosamine synthase-like glycosyltransferase
MAAILLCALYFTVLLALSAFGLHRLHLVILCRRHRQRIEKVPALAGPRVDDVALPIVTIQLPIFNESTVIERLLESVVAMDYPKDRLHIQVLDDSTDETRQLARAKVEELCQRGYDVDYVHRVDRVGYKAGALDHGLALAKGELVAVFDADFVPRPDFCRAIVGHFADPGVAMVQARWAHLNRDASLLTRVQALMLDGHHLVENRARYGAELLFNFSGTGGMWRRAAIYDAGGWQHDTLTEDLDLSYRAQLRGWKFIYRPDVVSPAELPEDIAALRAQQYRWAKGTVQTARKLLRAVLRSDLRLAQKVEAMFHLTPHFAYPLMVCLTILLLPVLLSVEVKSFEQALLFDLPLCMAPISSLAAFYMLADSAQGRSRWSALKLLPALIALGAGIAPHLASAVNEGLKHQAGEFVRTPKYGTNRWRYRAVTNLPVVEPLCAVLMLVSVIVALRTGHYFAAPFAALFMVGYALMSYLVVAEEWAHRRRASAEASQLAEAGARDSGVRTVGEGRKLPDLAA